MSATAVDPQFRGLGSVAASVAMGDAEGVGPICGDWRSLLTTSITPPQQQVYVGIYSVSRITYLDGRASRP